MSKPFFLLCVLAVVLGSSLVQAAPVVERVDPPSLRRGAATRITVKGRELDQVIGVWSSAPGTPWSTQIVTPAPRQEVARSDRFPERSLRSDEPGRSPIHPTHDCVVDVTVPSDLPLGLYALRLVTKSGFSNVFVVLVDELPTARRSELAKASTDNMPVDVPLPASVAADCRSAVVDLYGIDVKAGQRVSFEVIGNRLGKDFDPLVTIRDANGRVIARRDNDVGLFFDCRFAHTFEAAGRYVVEVRDARYDGHPFWNYVLRMGDFPAARVAIPSAIALGVEQQIALPEVGASLLKVTATASPRADSFFLDVRATAGGLATWLPFSATSLENRLEVEPNDELTNATPAVVPGLLNGVLQQRGDQDIFALELKKGQNLQFEAAVREIGSPADLELVLFDQMGKEVRRVDDVSVQRNGVSTTYEARFDFNVGQDGLYKLLVRDLSGSGGLAYGYRIEVADVKPTIELIADYAAFTIPRSSWQPIPITVTRNRITGPVELELLGAPPGVTLEPRTIPAEATEIVCKLLVAETATDSIGTIQIVGRCQSADGKLTAESLVKSYPLIDRQLRNKDRIPYALRDNQANPPPSLPDRLALQITAPIPFSVEVPFADLLVTKYQPTPFSIETTRTAGFDSPISFAAVGGQIGTEAEERDNIFLQMPDAVPSMLNVAGLFHNRILTQYQKKRADLIAVAEHGDRYVTLIRPFQLDVRSAFKPTFDPPTVSVEPGKSARVKLIANRTPTYSGEVTLSLQQPIAGTTLSEKLVIPANVAEIEIEFQVAIDLTPRRLNPRFQSTGNVGKYEEEINEPTLNIDVTKPK